MPTLDAARAVATGADLSWFDCTHSVGAGADAGCAPRVCVHRACRCAAAAAAAATASPLPSIDTTTSFWRFPSNWTLRRLPVLIPVPVGCRRMIYHTRVTRVTVPPGPRQSQLEPARGLRLSRSRSSQRRILIPPISSCWQPPVTSRLDPALLPVKQTQPVPALNCRLLLFLLLSADPSSSHASVNLQSPHTPAMCGIGPPLPSTLPSPQHHGRARTCPNRPWGARANPQAPPAYPTLAPALPGLPGNTVRFDLAAAATQRRPGCSLQDAGYGIHASASRRCLGGHDATRAISRAMPVNQVGCGLLLSDTW